MGCIGHTLSLDNLEVALVVGDLLADLAVEARVKLRQGQLTLARVALLHALQLSNFLSDDLGSMRQVCRHFLLLLEHIDLFLFDFAHSRIELHKFLHFKEVPVTINLSFLLWPDTFQLHRLSADLLVEVAFKLF